MARAKQEKKARGAQKGRRAMTELMKEGKLPEEELKAAKEPAKVAALKAETPVERKKPGRKPMTEEQKAEAKRLRDEAKAQNVKATVYVQYAGVEAEVNALTEAAKADFKESHKRTKITSLRLYIKPEDYAAYYVVNENFAGKVDL